MFIISASIKTQVHLKTSCINSSDSAHLFSRPENLQPQNVQLRNFQTQTTGSTFNHFPCSKRQKKYAWKTSSFFPPNPQVRVVGFDKPSLEATKTLGVKHPENKHLGGLMRSLRVSSFKESLKIIRSKLLRRR